MSGRSRIASLVVLTALAMAAGGVSPAADWSESLEANTDAAYVSNPQLLPGSHLADRSAQLAVDGSTTAQTERGQLSLTPRFAMTRYQRETGLDIDTGSLDLSYLRKFERGQWTVSGQALTDSTLSSELGLTGITSVNRRHYASTVSTGYQYFSTERLSWQLQGAWQDTRYSDALRFGLTNYAYSSVQFGPTWNFSQRLQGSLMLATDQISPQVGAIERDYSASLLLKRSLSERYAWRVSAGATRVDSARSGSVTSTRLEIGASHTGERIQWDLSVKRAVAPIGLGLLARTDQATVGVAANTSARSTLNLSVSAIRTEPVTVFIYLTPQVFFPYLLYSGASWGQASAEWRYRLSGHWALSAVYLKARARSGSLQEWADGSQARVGVLWQSGRL